MTAHATTRSRLFQRSTHNPILSAARRALPGELGLQPRRGTGGRRDHPAGPRRGHARHLPAPGRPQQGRRHRTGDSIPSRCSAPMSIAIPRRSGAARTLASPGCRTRGMGDPVHRLQPSRAARVAGDDPRLPDGRAGSVRSCRRRTRTPPSSPSRFDGRWAMIHRPSPLRGGAHMWISYSPDLRHWGDHTLLLEARDGAWWDAGKIGLGPPPLETAEAGWSCITASMSPATARSTGSGSRCSTSPTLASCCIGSTNGSSGPSSRTSWRATSAGRLPVRLDARRGDRPAALYYGAADTPSGSRPRASGRPGTRPQRTDTGLDRAEARADRAEGRLAWSAAGRCGETSDGEPPRRAVAPNLVSTRRSTHIDAWERGSAHLACAESTGALAYRRDITVRSAAYRSAMARYAALGSVRPSGHERTSANDAASRSCCGSSLAG